MKYTPGVEELRIKRLIQKDILPRTHFFRDSKGNLERRPQPGYPRGKLTWRLVDTVRKLTEK